MYNEQQLSEKIIFVYKVEMYRELNLKKKKKIMLKEKARTALFNIKKNLLLVKSKIVYDKV